MSAVQTPEILAGNSYDSKIYHTSRQNALGTPLRSSDIGHEVNRSLLASTTRLNNVGVSGLLVFKS